MALWLDRSSTDFETRCAAFLTTKREVAEDVNATVREIIADVRARGDEALAEYSLRFDQVDFAVTPMRVRSRRPAQGWPAAAFQASSRSRAARTSA